MEEILKTYRQTIIDHLTDFLELQSQLSKSSNNWGVDLCTRLIPFVAKGKIARGSLVCFSYEMFKGSITPDVIKAAAAVELIHACFVIHDDIMDKDLQRRGQKSIYAQYIDLAETKKLEDAHHFGESMGICVGDMTLFFAGWLFADINASSGIMAKLIKFYSESAFKVVMGQMEDMYQSRTNDLLDEASILGILRDKTAAYTICMPICAGAILAEQSQETVDKLYAISEKIGIIFQIRDDELGVFGDSKKTGKPVGADIREGKKTLLYLYLFENSSQPIKKKLKGLFGNTTITEADVAYVQNQMKFSGVPERIQETITRLRAETLTLIEDLTLSPENKKKLEGILDFCATRQN